MRWWRDPRMPAEDDNSRQVYLRRDILAVEKQLRSAMWAAVLIGGILLWQYEEALGPTVIILTALIVGVLLAIHEQVCGLRAHAFRRELLRAAPQGRPGH